MNSLNDASNDNGFKDENELFQMVSNVDLTKNGNLEKFKDWQLNDGSKEGLQELLGT